jgi:hypothetical protein
MNANDMVHLKVLAHTHGLMAAEEAYVRSGRDVATISEAGLRLLQATTTGWSPPPIAWSATGPANPLPAA